MIILIQELHQLLGDADAHLADRLSDIEGSLRLHFLEMRRSPASVILGVLSTMEPDEQLKRIDTIEQFLTARKNRLNSAEEGD